VLSVAGNIIFASLWTFLFICQLELAQRGSWSKYVQPRLLSVISIIAILQAKKVIVFLGRASPTHMVKELMKELEVWNCGVLRGVTSGVHLLECRASAC